MYHFPKSTHPNVFAKTNSRTQLFINSQRQIKPTWKDLEKQHGFWKALTETTLIFFKESTLHGFKQVSQDIENLGSTSPK